MTTALITGAGTGFGRDTAFRLAERTDFDVIAGVEIYAQVWELEQEAARRGVRLRVEKLDVTHPGDRDKAAGWEVDVLLNNAGVSEGGAMVDIPGANLRRQFEVNVIGPLLLTQGIAKRMVANRRGRIVFMSSIAGLITDPFGGAYAASKHAVEAVADAMRQELAEFGIEVATINPGPYLTGFNDRLLDTWQSWDDDPERRLFDYRRVAFPHEQFDPAPVADVAVGVLTGEIDTYRNVVPGEMVGGLREQLDSVWKRRAADGVGERSPMVDKAYELSPETPAT
ncbi:SDR family oxidoreductase [Nocardia africana]|uniref:Cyclopentanol dehydrogenase n=1 Tax=Nocardia africana TaxID=134964 RepID=A0A378WNR1_9NOCA|nr:SDR family oxidoreductase [Nocardia africana]MCC3314888.1 SDR family oxidoreductase [Nocardia africana]SUA42829.1 Cyclopentanol dehydrogenase [Nocardia africana]